MLPMRRLGLLVWALWLMLAPLGAAWAYACTCAALPAIKCCAEATPAACCQPETLACGVETNVPCPNCPACTLEEAKPAPAAQLTRFLLEWADWVIDAPAPNPALEAGTATQSRGLPTVRNHSPPLVAHTPRAPPLC